MIHQPHFLPWPGYVSRCLAADTFVVLDNVKFNKNHYQQRTKFVGADGRERWLSLPINHSTASRDIAEVRIADAFSFRDWQRPFVHAYQASAELEPVWEKLSGLISGQSPSLLSVNLNTLLYLLETLAHRGAGRAPKVVLASSLPASTDRTGRLIDICRIQGITHLVMGRDALASHDGFRLRAAGLVLVQHVYMGSVDRLPTPGVSVLDDWFRRGSQDVAQHLKLDWQTKPLL